MPATAKGEFSLRSFSKKDLEEVSACFQDIIKGAAHNCVIYGAKSIAGACYDLLHTEGLLDAVKAEYAENKKKYQ